ncbi:PfkB family carbohydrate kinase [Micromonospora sp. WMMD1128]|uniref:PfkB family carbohydrate kinase n=1 Tax=Micromonospora sp. WMMD1128 TaxID=3015150 RepID=UPI00248BEE61|nr:PfkB family carbohydrate kinase [Micromonospora sp. WMMD1128]WBB75149.1 PfkB family carbohydrate kinase [Micromonospora sp. WMMD1128]
MVDLLVLGGLGVDVRARVPALPLPAADSLTVPPVDLRIGNTGAGDAFAAGLIAARLRGAGTRDAARYAARVAAAACAHDGMEYPDGLLPRD